MLLGLELENSSDLLVTLLKFSGPTFKGETRDHKNELRVRSCVAKLLGVLNPMSHGGLIPPLPKKNQQPNFCLPMLKYIMQNNKIPLL